MERIYKHRHLIMVIALATAAMVLFLPIVNANTKITWVQKTYVVQRGDSLWHIASIYCPEKYNTWDWIEQVTESNNIKNYTIYEGQHLIVPTVNQKK